jgi:hypothetical protein
VKHTLGRVAAVAALTAAAVLPCAAPALAHNGPDNQNGGNSSQYGPNDYGQDTYGRPSYTSSDQDPGVAWTGDQHQSNGSDQYGAQPYSSQNSGHGSWQNGRQQNQQNGHQEHNGRQQDGRQNGRQDRRDDAGRFNELGGLGFITGLLGIL